MKPTFPSAETPQGQQDRAARLQRQRTLYEYSYTYLPQNAIHKSMPSKENFSATFIAEIVLSVAKIIPNALATAARSLFDPLDELQDYEDFFNTIALPPVAKVYQTDESFAEQRLSGANPLMLRLLKPGDARATPLLAIKPKPDPSFDIVSQLAAGNIYITDYTGTDPAYRGPSMIQGGTYTKGKKSIPKPLAYFRWVPASGTTPGKLLPLAIQLLASTDPAVYKPSGARVYLPSGTPGGNLPLDWLFAKICVQIADANHHELSTHLGRTHLVMWPIALGTARQLDESHPINILLRPHLRFMMSINDLALKALLNPGGFVDRIFAGTLNESLAATGEACATWDLRKFAFPQDIKDRGLDDVKRLPHYPYRDDGMLLWGAVEAYVRDYVTRFYPNDASVVADVELQAWAKELSDLTNGGKVRGMPNRFVKVSDLSDILTTIIFTAGPLHSAVNFSQDDYLGFAPNLPLSAYLDVNALATQTAPITTKQILQMLPPSQQATDQLNLVTLLSNYRFDSLGDFDKSFREMYRQKYEEVFAGDAVTIALWKKFRARLTEVEATIVNSNQTRAFPYEFMRPSQIVNSISI